jgi:rhamnose utilization protein RhaD (predicted bifunctional aldolase and dehydrogenase)
MSRQRKDKALAELIRMSRQAGKDPGWTQGSSGNTSVKTNDNKHIFIKASGTALRNMSIKKGWRRLRLDNVLNIIYDSRLNRLPEVKREREIANQLLMACDDSFTNDIKPSIEAPLHAILGKCVIHLHPKDIGAYVSSKNGKKEVTLLFKNDRCKPLWITQAVSGMALAKMTSRLINGYKKRFGSMPAIIFLSKHGLFVSANTPNEAIKLTQKAINRCKSKLHAKGALCRPPAERDVKPVKNAIVGAISITAGRRPEVSFFFNRDIAKFIRRKDAGKLLAKGPLSAAEIVYTGGAPVWIEKPDKTKIASALKKYIKKEGSLPAAFIVKDLGLFVAADRKNASAIAEVVSGSLYIRSQAARFGGILALSRQEKEFIRQCYLPQSIHKAGKGR